MRPFGLGFTLFFAMMFLIVQFVALFWFLSRGRTYFIFPGEYDVSFDDVRGQKAAVEATKEVVRLFQGFKKFRKMGGYPPQGILLEGPPGTGKTLLSKAIAGEVNVPFIYASASSFTNMFMGVGNLRVMRLFSKARKFSERYGGAVIFMDELDAIGSRGGVVQSMEPYPFHEPFRHGLEDRLLGSQGEEPRRSGVAGFVDRVFGGMGMGGMLVNELLVQMDGLIQPRGLRRFLRRLIPLTIRKRLRRKVPTYNILVIGATNRADSLDPALLRPGRFDRRLHVGLPDKEGRKDIAGYYLNKVRHDDIDLEKLAKATAFGTIPNELAGGSSIGAMLRDTAVREEVSDILAEARKEIEDLLRDKSAIVEGVRDALLQREDIDRLFARLEARGEPQGSGVV